MRKEIGLIGTFSTMLVLPQWTSSAPIKEMRGTRLQHACFETIWKKTAPASGSKREERCSTSA